MVPLRRTAMTRVLCPHSRLTAVVFALLCLLGMATRHAAEAACSLPTALQGYWYKVDTGNNITMTSSETSGQDIKHGSQEKYLGDFDCFDSSGDQYVFKTRKPVMGSVEEVHGYFCWKLVQASDVAVLLYQLTAVAKSGAYNTERIHELSESETAPTVAAVCSLSFTSQIPTLLYKYASDTLAVAATGQQQCSPELFATYSYVKDDTDCAGSASKLDFCSDHQTAKADYTACATKILYSKGGVLSCVAETTVQSAVYQILYNQDANVDNVDYFKFVCLKVTKSGDDETATVYSSDCTSSTSHKLVLIRTVSCPIEDGDGGGGGGGDDDRIPIIVGVVCGVVAIAAIIVVAVLVYKLVYKKRKMRAVTPTKPVRNGNSVHDVDVPPSKEEESTPNGLENMPRRGSSLPPLVTTTPKLEPLRQ